MRRLLPLVLVLCASCSPQAQRVTLFAVRGACALLCGGCPALLSSGSRPIVAFDALPDGGMNPVYQESDRARSEP